MDSWERLYDELAASRRAREQATRDADKVMTGLAAQARKRSAELHERTGLEVEVEFPATGPPGRPGDGAYRTFLRLRSDPHEVHVYAHCGADGACALHTFRGGREQSGRKRVSSKLVCFVAPGARDLRDPAGASLTVDDLVLRAFRQVVRSFLEEVGVSPRRA